MLLNNYEIYYICIYYVYIVALEALRVYHVHHRLACTCTSL